MKAPSPTDTTRVEDSLPVRELHAKLRDAEACERQLSEEAATIESALNPNLISARSFSEDEMMSFELRRPSVRQELFLCRKELKALSAEYQVALSNAIEDLAAARKPPRQALMRRLFDALDGAATIAQELRAHDAQTAELSGGAVKFECPWPEFVANSSGESKLDWRRRAHAEWL